MRGERSLTLCVLAMTVALWLLPTIARADDVAVRTLELGSWPDAIAALQADLHGEGRVIHVVVQDSHGQIAPCGSYVLHLDTAGAQAFVLGGCSQNATAVHLAHRGELFDHGDVVPQPRAVGIAAVETRTGEARGGAAPAGGSEVHCSVGVRPFLRDLEHGTTTYLQPGRFQLRVVTTGVTTSIGDGQWTLHGSAQGTVAVEYEVVDTLTGHSVTHDRTMLTCGNESMPPTGTEPAHVQVVRAGEAPRPGELVVGGSAHGSTRGAVDRHAGTCGGSMAADRTIPLWVASPSRLRLIASGSFGLVMYVLPHNGDGHTELGCARWTGAHVATMVRDFPAGDYDVVLDGATGEEGDFNLTVTAVPASEPEASSVAHGTLTLGSTVTGDTRQGTSEYHGSCVNSTAPEVIYTVHIADRGFVVADLASDYDGVLYLRSVLDDPTSERACNDDYGDTRHSRITAMLDPGDYYLFVDGYGTGAGTFTLHISGETEREATASRHVRGPLNLGTMSDQLFPGVSLTQGLCGGAGPEAVYTLHLDRPSFVTVRLHAGFPSVLSVRTSMEPPVTGELVCHPGTVTEVSQHFDPGEYFVVVDSLAPAVTGSYTLNTAIEPDSNGR